MNPHSASPTSDRCPLTSGSSVELNVNGILARPGHAEGWTDRAVTHAHLDLGLHAEKLENFTGVLTRMLRQERRAEFVARIANKYLERGWTVYLRGHSNGCDIIRRALFHTSGTIEGVQLIAPAVEPDFEKNGFNSLLREHRVKYIVICGGPNDRALKWARISHPILNLFGNAYGTLGLVGPKNVADDVGDKVFYFISLQYNHSDWLVGDNVLKTMRLLHPHHNPNLARNLNLAA